MHLTVPYRVQPHITVPHRTLPYLTMPHRAAPHRAQQIKGFAFVNAYSISIMLTTPFVMVMLTLVVYFNGNGDFSPDVVFTAVSLLLMIRFPLMMLPMAIASWVQGKVRKGCESEGGGPTRQKKSVVDIINVCYKIAIVGLLSKVMCHGISYLDGVIVGGGGLIVVWFLPARLICPPVAMPWLAAAVAGATTRWVTSFRCVLLVCWLVAVGCGCGCWLLHHTM